MSTHNKYSWEELEERVKRLNKGVVILSNQYGMVFLLNPEGEIILNLTELVSKKERMKHA